VLAKTTPKIPQPEGPHEGKRAPHVVKRPRW